MGKGTPRGIHAARKLLYIRRKNKLKQKSKARKDRLKKDPRSRSGYYSGIVIEKFQCPIKNRGRWEGSMHSRKSVVVQRFYDGKKIVAFVPNDGNMNYICENDKVVIRSTRHRKNLRDADPFQAGGNGVKFVVEKVLNVSLKALYLGKKEKPRT